LTRSEPATTNSLVGAMSPGPGAGLMLVTMTLSTSTITPSSAAARGPPVATLAGVSTIGTGGVSPLVTTAMPDVFPSWIWPKKSATVPESMFTRSPTATVLPLANTNRPELSAPM
jgi:hypothetical protein